MIWQTQSKTLILFSSLTSILFNFFSGSAREVPAEEGKKLAAERGLAWIETSAKSNQNVARVFDMCLEEIEKSLHPNTGGAPKDDGCIVM